MWNGWHTRGTHDIGGGAPTPRVTAAQPAIAGGAGVFIAPAQFSSNIWGVYLLDVDQQTICAYSVSGNPPQYPREMQRTTISGDYGLGRMEISGSAAPAGLDV